ncbi:MAG TPA: hypothetical protein VGB37_10000 [Candidatus Lokiarchaeia archaeon]
MDLSKLTNEELLKLKSKFAGEVSKKTYGTSSSESSVQVANPAPKISKRPSYTQDFIKVEIPKANEYNKEIDLKDLEIKQIDYSLAKIFIKENHYSHTIPSSVKVSLGFYYKEELKTAIIYGAPVGRNVTNWLQVEHSNCLELVRLFSAEGMPKNTESYCISKSFQFLKQNYPQYKYLISYADPNHGHCGYIYQATNWKYVGIQRRILKERIILIDGKEVHSRTLNAKHGSNADDKLKEIYGDRLEIKGALKKYVYLMCLGNHKECKEWYNKFTFLPYPKAHNDIIEGKAQ